MNRINWNMRKFVFTIITILLVLISYVPKAEAANFFLVPASSAVYVGSTFYVYLKVNSSEMASNSYSAVINFDPAYVEPISVLKSGSICTLFVSEPKLNASSASITCGLPSPGFQGGGGNLVIVNLRAKKVGTTSMGVSSGAILANDGYGTNILRSSNGTNVRIIAREQAPQVEEPEAINVSPPTVTSNRGESGSWTGENDLEFSWNKPENAEGFSFSISQDQNVNPPDEQMTDVLKMNFADVEDGTWYFKIKGVNGTNYSEVVEYIIRVDTVGPEKFDVVLEPPGDDVITTIPILGFSAYDYGSGVANYQMKFDDGEFGDVTNPHIFSQISSGSHTVILRVFDVVGNYTDKEITFSVIEFEAPTITNPINSQVIQSTDGVMIEGTATPNSSVLIYINGELVGTAQSDDQGVFVFNLNRSLTGGEYELTAQIKTDGGILGKLSDSVLFTIEENFLPTSALTVFGENTTYIFGGCCSLLLLLLIILLLIFLRRRRKEEEKDELVGAIPPDVNEKEEEDVVTDEPVDPIEDTPPVTSNDSVDDQEAEDLERLNSVESNEDENISIKKDPVSDQPDTGLEYQADDPTPIKEEKPPAEEPVRHLHEMPEKEPIPTREIDKLDGLDNVATVATAAVATKVISDHIDEDPESEEDSLNQPDMSNTTPTDDLETRSEVEKLQIENRIADAKLEIDHELHSLEKKIREEIENDPTQTRESEHRLEHAVTDAIEESEEKIESILDEDKIIDGIENPNEKDYEEETEDTSIGQITTEPQEGGLMDSLKKDE